MKPVSARKVYSFLQRTGRSKWLRVGLFAALVAWGCALSAQDKSEIFLTATQNFQDRTTSIGKLAMLILGYSVAAIGIGYTAYKMSKKEDWLPWFITAIGGTVLAGVGTMVFQAAGAEMVCGLGGPLLDFMGAFGSLPGFMPFGLSHIGEAFYQGTVAVLEAIGIGGVSIAPFLAFYSAVKVGFNVYQGKPFVHLLGWCFGGLAVFVSGIKLIQDGLMHISIAVAIADGDATFIQNWFRVDRVSNAIGAGLLASALFNVGMKMAHKEPWTRPLILGAVGACVMAAGSAVGGGLYGGADGSFFSEAAVKSHSLLYGMGRVGSQVLGVACVAIGIGSVAVKLGHGDPWVKHFVLAAGGAALAAVATFVF